jgi:hypothetical protein
LEKEIAKLQGELEKDRIPDLIAQKQVIGGANALIAPVNELTGNNCGRSRISLNLNWVPGL